MKINVDIDVKIYDEINNMIIDGYIIEDDNLRFYLVDLIWYLGNRLELNYYEL